MEANDALTPAEMGRKGGQSKSRRKQDAARRNLAKARKEAAPQVKAKKRKGVKSQIVKAT